MNKIQTLQQLIPGFTYIPNFLSDHEHDKILLALSTTDKFTSIVKNSRKVLQYGYSYDYNGTNIKKIKNIPPYLKKISYKSHLPNDYFDQLIINEYLPGQGIFEHIDKVTLFEDNILCITVGGGITIEFTKNDIKHSVYVEPKSAYIMSGDARYKWKHGIKKIKNDIIDGVKIPRITRYSLTYRKVKK